MSIKIIGAMIGVLPLLLVGNVIYEGLDLESSANTAVAAQPATKKQTVQPTPINPTPQDEASQQLDIIESKIDQVLELSKEHKKQLGDLSKSNYDNTTRIVDAIKGLDKGSGASTVTKVKYRSVSSPRWRINGKVWTRSSIISHLKKTHKVDDDVLSSMTLQQLWAYHDDLHDAETLDVVPVDPCEKPSVDCPNGICPTGFSRVITRTRKVVFPNAWWNR